MNNSVSVLIPTWNGRSLLEKYLANNLIILDKESAEWEVIVVDNGSTDGTVEWLGTAFSRPLKAGRLRIIALPENRGFGPALNIGLAAVRHPYTYLLNNDIALTDGSLAPLFPPLQRDRVFATYPWQRVRHGDSAVTYAGCPLAFRRGYYRAGTQFGGDFSAQTVPQPGWYASGAAALFHTDKLRELGGFCPLLSPAYFEDTDLSHRAWQRGWHILSVPTPPVDHWHESTATRFPRYALQVIQQRNFFFYQWVNIHDRRYWLLHFFWLPVNLVRDSLRSPATLSGFWQALRRAGEVRAFRMQQTVRRTDRQVIAAIAGSRIEPSAPILSPLPTEPEPAKGFTVVSNLVTEAVSAGRSKQAQAQEEEQATA
jgi:GT2 family glycosyltransferase